MANLCLIDNMASHYRKAIYLLMDKEFDIDWYFGEPMQGVKTFENSLLKNVKDLSTKRYNHLPGYWMDGISEAIESHDTVIMIGEPALWSTWSLLFKYRLCYPKKKVIFWTHGWYGKETYLRTIIKKFYFKLGSFVLTYGDYARELMIKEGFNGDKIMSIHNSLDYDSQLSLRNTISPKAIYCDYFGNSNHNIVYIGRLAKYKKLHLLISALKQLSNKGNHYNLTIIGNGECEIELRKQVTDCGLDKNVWFYGACYDEQKNADLIYNADLSVSPGNVGLNAVHTLMFGTPIATHNSYPYQGPEFECIHEGTTGTFFMKDNVDDIARVISDWFSNHKDDRDDIRIACFKEIDDNWTPQFQINVLKKILSKQ